MKKAFPTYKWGRLFYRLHIEKLRNLRKMIIKINKIKKGRRNDMNKDVNVRDKETDTDVIPLYTLNKMKKHEKDLIEKQKERIVELKRLNITRAFELDILNHFISVMGLENEYQEFKEGYLLGIKKHAH